MQRPAADGSPETITENYSPAYYPDAISPEFANAVRLRGGQVTSDIDLEIKMTKSYSVSGNLDGLLPGIAPPEVLLQPADSSRLGAIRISVPHPGDSRFHFNAVPPGDYVLATSTLRSAGNILKAREEIAVSGPVSGVVLPLRASFSVAGFAVAEDGAKLPSGTKLRIATIDGRFGVDLKLNEDGRFEVPTIAPDKYSFSVAGDKGKTFVKSAILNTREVQPNMVPLTEPPQDLKLIVSETAGRIEGHAVDADDRAVTSGLAVLVGTVQGVHAYATQLGADGGFAFRSLPPGRYRVLCFSDLSSSDEATWDVQKKVEARGEGVEIVESDQKQITVKVVQMDSN